MERTKECKICEKTFINNNDLTVHLKSNYHLQKTKSHTSIYINHVPREIYIDDVINCISQFGKIIKYDVINNSSYNNITIEFKDKESVQAVLSETIIINNKQLYIYPLQYNERKDDRTHVLCYDRIKTVLNKELNFNNQLEAFLKAVAITDEEVKLYYQPVCQELDQLFQKTFSKCKSYMFGSIVTGLGFKNSDLDIYLNIGKPVVEEDTCIHGPHVITMDRLFWITTTVLRKNKALFSKCCPIRTAKMPIIKCTYQPTNVLCDISFKNNIALYNSKLVHYYLSIHYHFTPIMMLIKYWLYNYESTNGGITKYAMTMLFIFYLQQVKLVPPVIQLQKECVIPIFIKGWQVNINKGTTKINAQNDYINKSIPEILGDFFKFYANYDFKTQVICPFDGQSHSKESFDRKRSPSNMMTYINYLKSNENPEELSSWKPLCLQDPIELNHNLTKNINTAYLEKMQDYFAIAAKIVETSSKNNYRDLLQTLFNNSTVMYSKIKRESFSLVIYPEELFETDKNMLIMSKILKIINWFDLTLNFIKQILLKVLNLKIKDSNVMHDLRKREIKNQETTISKDENVIVLHCKGNQRLWFNRKDVKAYSVSNALEKEIIISKRILNSIGTKKNEMDVIINLEFHISRRSTPSDHMHITIYDNGCSGKIFNEFVNYFQVKTPSIMKKMFSNIRNDASILESFLKS